MFGPLQGVSSVPVRMCAGMMVPQDMCRPSLRKEEKNPHPSTHGACGALFETLRGPIRAPLAHSCLGPNLGHYYSRREHSERRTCVRRILYRFLSSCCQVVPAQMANIGHVLFPTTGWTVSTRADAEHSPRIYAMQGARRCLSGHAYFLRCCAEKEI